MSGNLSIPPAEWLAEMFECEYCAECGGDASHHTAVPFEGNWFARCDYPAPDDSEEWHPVIKAFRAEPDAEAMRQALEPILGYKPCCEWWRDIDRSHMPALCLAPYGVEHTHQD